MYGALDLYIRAKDIGVKPIIGCEFYVTTGDIKDKSQNNREYFHLVLIAKNETGYKNLIKLVSIAQIDGFYYKPRINHELLKTYHDGLICLSACLQGEICQTLLKKSYQETIDVAKFYKELFNDDYYLEIQDHGLPDQKRTNPDIIKIGKELDIPIVITNDSLKPHFRNMIKQRGGMFAKGFLFGTQFKAYFKDDLWLSMARHAVSQAQRIQAAAIEKGYSLYAVSPTNQVFLVLSHAQIERLKQDFAFELNGHVDKDHEAARFVCSWATRPEAVDALIAAL